MTTKMSSPILPGQTIGIIGGGQLGRMMAISARYMGYRIVVLDPTPDCPTAQIADEQLVAPYDDMQAIEQLIDMSDVITYEFENVDLDAARFIESHGKLPQGSKALKVTQHRQREKELLQDLNLRVPNFMVVHHRQQCEEAFKQFEYPFVVKSCRGGYDGKGQYKVEHDFDLEGALAFAEQHYPCLIEQWIECDQEISIIFTRSQAGEMTLFPMAENMHQDHILDTTFAPADVTIDVKKQAHHIAKTIAEALDVVGTFAIELFVADGDVFVNEMAPRPHNSGHFTIEACSVSQFAQHMRAICQLPLIPVQMYQKAMMVNILGEHITDALTFLKTNKNGFLHMYGKEEAKPKRKMGHLTFIDESIDVLKHLKQTLFKEDAND